MQSDGSYEAVVLKQVLWVSGTSYVLHEIFGIDRSADDPEVWEVEGTANSNKVRGLEAAPPIRV